MKKFLVGLLTVALAASMLVGCGKKEEKKKAEPTSTASAGQPRQTIHYNLEPEKVPGGYCLVALLVLLGAFVAALLFGWIVSAFP